MNEKVGGNILYMVNPDSDSTSKKPSKTNNSPGSSTTNTENTLIKRPVSTSSGTSKLNTPETRITKMPSSYGIIKLNTTEPGITRMPNSTSLVNSSIIAYDNPNKSQRILGNISSINWKLSRHIKMDIFAFAVAEESRDLDHGKLSFRLNNDESTGHYNLEPKTSFVWGQGSPFLVVHDPLNQEQVGYQPGLENQPYLFNLAIELKHQWNNGVNHFRKGMLSDNQKKIIFDYYILKIDPELKSKFLKGATNHLNANWGDLMITEWFIIHLMRAN
jgi:hypothetical protein